MSQSNLFEAYERSSRMYKYIEGQNSKLFTVDNHIKESVKSMIKKNQEIINKKHKIERIEQRHRHKKLETAEKVLKGKIRKLIKLSQIEVKPINEMKLIRIEFYGLNREDEGFICYCDIDVDRENQSFVCLEIHPEFEDSYICMHHSKIHGSLNKFVKEVRGKFVEFFQKKLREKN